MTTTRQGETTACQPSSAPASIVTAWWSDSAVWVQRWNGSRRGLFRDADGQQHLDVGEVGVTDWKTSFAETPMPPELKITRCLQKLEKI
jgi:hypothetical protein